MVSTWQISICRLSSIFWFCTSSTISARSRAPHKIFSASISAASFDFVALSEAFLSSWSIATCGTNPETRKFKAQTTSHTCSLQHKANSNSNLVLVSFDLRLERCDNSFERNCFLILLSRVNSSQRRFGSELRRQCLFLLIG